MNLVIKFPSRILDSYNLTVDEASLTGESVAISKGSNTINNTVSIHDMHNLLFASTNIVTGRCMGVVINTGINTEIGHITSKIHNNPIFRNAKWTW